MRSLSFHDDSSMTSIKGMPKVIKTRLGFYNTDNITDIENLNVEVGTIYVASDSPYIDELKHKGYSLAFKLF